MLLIIKFKNALRNVLYLYNQHFIINSTVPVVRSRDISHIETIIDNNKLDPSELRIQLKTYLKTMRTKWFNKSRSRLRDEINAVLDNPKYSDLAFAKEEIVRLKQQLNIRAHFETKMPKTLVPLRATMDEKHETKYAACVQKFQQELLDSHDIIEQYKLTIERLTKQNHDLFAHNKTLMRENEELRHGTIEPDSPSLPLLQRVHGLI